jgi:hypothetical protein
MASKKIKKVAVNTTTDIGGLKSSRYEKLQVSYGSIEASSYAFLDTLVFADVPARDIIKASIIAHTDPVVSLEVYPGTDVSAPLTLDIPEPAKISYIIEYVRGTGRVGPEGYGTDAYGSGQALESGEGDLLQVAIGDISKLDPQAIADLNTATFAGLTETQIEDLTIAQIPEIEPEDFAALSAQQLQAFEIVDLQQITAAQLAALSPAQLASFTDEQKLEFTQVQKDNLTNEQLAAINS